MAIRGYVGERPPEEDLKRWREVTLAKMQAEEAEMRGKAAKWAREGRSMRSVRRFENQAAILRRLIADLTAELEHWGA